MIYRTLTDEELDKLQQKREAKLAERHGNARYFTVVHSVCDWWEVGVRFPTTNFAQSLHDGCFQEGMVFLCPDGEERIVQRKICRHGAYMKYSLLPVQLVAGKYQQIDGPVYNPSYRSNNRSKKEATPKPGRRSIMNVDLSAAEIVDAVPAGAVS